MTDTTFQPKAPLSLKKKLAAALDDDLHTRVWHNYVDYLIIFMILLSTVEIFLSTLQWSPVGHAILRAIDIITLIFFTVEVSLRLWVLPEINPKYKGLMGRLRYCTTFYGLIDILSTYPFYIQWLIPLPVMALKGLRVVRVVRIFRISRYAKSFTLLSDAMREKRHELIVSMQFLVVVTIVLSLLLYFFEHDVQPEVYDNGFVSVLWAFAQYIGDPGAFADTPPLTVPGRIIACIVGLLGIAIVAVPAGIIGSGFTEAIENDNKKKQLRENVKKMHNAFERKLDKPTGIQIVPVFRSFLEITARVNMNTDEIIDVCEECGEFRIVNLANTAPQEKMAVDRLAVEHFPLNRPYGCLIDRESSLTIIAPSNMADACVAHFAFYLALIGNFNYISREVGERAPYRSYYQYTDGAYKDDPVFAAYEADLKRLLSRQGAWGSTILVSSGANEPIFDTNVHLCIGGKKGDTRRSGDDLLVHDEVTYNAFYTSLEEKLAAQFGLTIDHQAIYDTSTPNLFVRRMGLDAHSNHIIMRLEWEKILWSSRRIELAKAVAEVLAETIAHRPIATKFPGKDVGFKGYNIPNYDDTPDA